MFSFEDYSLIILLSVLLLVPAWRSQFFFPKVLAMGRIRGKERLAFFDFAKGISVIAVIIIHVGYFYMTNEKDSASSFYFYLINNLSRFAIPVFLISSGVLLRPWDEIKEKHEFYKRKILRVFLPYVIAVTGLVAYYNASVSDYLVYLFNGRILIPYYFIIVLLQLYILYPLLSKYRRNKYLLPASFLLGFLMTIFIPSFTVYGIEPFVPYLFFFVYGMVMRDFFLSEEKQETKGILMWFAIIILYLAVFMIFPERYYNNRYFYGLAIFNILYYYRGNLLKHFNKTYLAIAHVGYYSLWIFLLHFLFEEPIYNLVSKWPIHVVWQYSLIAALTLLFTYLFARLLALLYLRMLENFKL